MGPLSQQRVLASRHGRSCQLILSTTARRCNPSLPYAGSTAAHHAQECARATLRGDAFALSANFMLKPRGSGQPLPEPIQKKMEGFFNASSAELRTTSVTRPPPSALWPSRTALRSTSLPTSTTLSRPRVINFSATNRPTWFSSGPTGAPPTGSGRRGRSGPGAEAQAERTGMRVASVAAPIQAKVALETHAEEIADPQTFILGQPETNECHLVALDPFNSAARAKTRQRYPPSLSTIQSDLDTSRFPVLEPLPSRRDSRLCCHLSSERR